MRLLNSLLLAITLLTVTPSAIGQDDTRDRPAESGSQTTDEKIRERKHILLLFPLAAAGAVVIALLVTRRKRPRRPDDTDR